MNMAIRYGLLFLSAGLSEWFIDDERKGEVEETKDKKEEHKDILKDLKVAKQELEEQKKIEKIIENMMHSNENEQIIFIINEKMAKSAEFRYAIQGEFEV